MSSEDGTMVIFDLGANIKEARQAANLTQSRLAELMDVTQKDISRWERNERAPSIMSLRKLCTTIGASADKLLGLA